MTNNKVTLKDVYDAVNDLEKKVCERYDHRIERIEIEVDANTNWRNKMVGQFTILMVIIGGAINLFWDYLFNK